MGQLEKYGLYVLCLLIFLIAGVSIWGSAELPLVPPSTPPLKARVASDPGKPESTRELGVTSDTSGAAGSLSDLMFNSVPRPGDVSKAPAGGDDGTKSAPAGGGAAEDKSKGGVAKDADAKGGETKTGETKTGDAKGGDTKGSPGPAPRSTYKVKSGDNFESIALAQLGDRRLKSEIARLNPRVDPNRMPIGQVLELPNAAGAEKTVSKVDRGSAADATTKGGGSRVYTIRKGDTLGEIARAELGSSKRVDELVQLNPGIDPRGLQLNQKIKLPAK